MFSARRREGRRNAGLGWLSIFLLAFFAASQTPRRER